MPEDRDTRDSEHDSGHSGDAGLPAKHEVPAETLEEIEAQRAERLDPDNRPENVEVDNTDRTFDPGTGRFTDDPDYDPQDQPFTQGAEGAES